MSKKSINMSLNEKDIFDYVFFPENLTAEKKIAIEEDKNLNEAIDFYKVMQADSQKPIAESLKEKIASKIPTYHLLTEIYLYPLSRLPEPKVNAKRLAADSESRNLISKMTSKTFVDEDKQYMIKVINYETQTKVFVFSSKDEIVKDFDIIIEPQNIKYHFDDNSGALLINKVLEAERIRIEFVR